MKWHEVYAGYQKHAVEVIRKTAPENHRWCCDESDHVIGEIVASHLEATASGPVVSVARVRRLVETAIRPLYDEVLPEICYGVMDRAKVAINAALNARDGEGGEDE